MNEKGQGNGNMILSAFDMNTVVHQNPGQWTDPQDQTYRYKELDYWIELATLLERGGFDALFIADVLGAYDVYGGSRDSALRNAAQCPVNDPMVLIPAMAAATERLCFGATVSLSYELPYAFARRMTSLDHYTKGRVAWNIVTSYQESAAVNLGMDKQIPHDERYDVADEFMEVCYKLWEGSWEDDAVIRDREKGVFIEPSKVHSINHKGKYYSVPGAHLCEPSPQRTPFLFQAGASARGRKFAATHAEAIFLIGTNAPDMRPIVDLTRMATAEQGRDPRSLKIIMMLTPIVAPTDEEAQAKLEHVQQHGSLEAALTLFAGWTGVDLSDAPPDKPLKQFKGDSVRAFSDMLTRVDSELVWTTRRLAEWLCVGGMSASAVGSPATIVDQMEHWMEVADFDGFNIARVTNFGTFTDFVDLVVPELRRRGHIPEEPKPPTTTRNRILGNGDRVADDHPGAAFRKGHVMKPKPAVPTTIEATPRKVGLLAILEAKPEKAQDLAAWLHEMLDHAFREEGTESWYAFQVDERTFGIYDTFPTEDGRQDHIHGEIVDSLRKIQQDLLAVPPKIRQVDLLAVKPAFFNGSAPQSTARSTKAGKAGKAEKDNKAVTA